MKNVKPMKDRLYVKRIPPPEKLILLTDVQTIRWAKVLAVGPQVKECKPGDIVMLPGIAAEEPDLEYEGGIFIMEGDVGLKVN